MQRIIILHGDCIERMKEKDAASIDAVICDPPYFLGFMNMEFDQQEGADSDPKKMQETHKKWLLEAFRVLKPEGLLLAMSGTRTFHRLGMAMEEAGFVDIDLEMWGYSSGFPKSLNIGKALDKLAGIDREVLGENPNLVGRTQDIKGGNYGNSQPVEKVESYITAPATELAQQYNGYGTALKPAYEPILTARKPVEIGSQEHESIPVWELL